jgi:hypothetical protein
MWSHPTSLEPIAKVGIILLKFITKGQNPEHQISQLPVCKWISNKRGHYNTFMELQ